MLKYIALVLIVISFDTNGQILQDMTVEEIPAGEGLPYIVRDANKAILIVHSQMAVMSFASNMGILKVDSPDPGEYILHLLPGTHIITFKSKGFSTTKQRYNIQPKRYREVRVFPSKPEVELLPVMIRVLPEPDSVKIDNTLIDLHSINRLEVGEHKVTINKSGYEYLEALINVSEQNVFFNFELVQIEPVIVNGPLPGMSFARIPAGSFEMGSPQTEDGHIEDESPVHTVNLKPYYLMTTEVTVGQFRRFVEDCNYITQAEEDSVVKVLGYIIHAGVVWQNKNDASWQNPYFAQTTDHPVTMISWKDTQEFIKWLNLKFPGKTYRLPTESEWEYACRAGTTTRFWSGDSSSDLDRVAWYRGNSKFLTYPVGSKEANKWGLHDMHGNAWEWCEDWLQNDYNDTPADGSAWTLIPGTRRVLRGGCCISYDKYCRSACRTVQIPRKRPWTYGLQNSDDAEGLLAYRGFRVAYSEGR